jgi:hypothetical protein
MSDEVSDETTTTTESQVTVERSPRYARFMLAGVLLFAVISLILTFAFPQAPGYDPGQVFGFLLLFGSVAGVALGAIVAIVIDRIAGRRARTITADRIDVRASTSEPAELGEASDTQNPTSS